jgi:hypothetical protein
VVIAAYSGGVSARSGSVIHVLIRSKYNMHKYFCPGT